MRRRHQRRGTGNQNLTGSPNYAPRILISGDPGSGCSSNQYAQFNTAAFAVPAASASNPSLGLESGQNYLHGCFDKTVDLALARNFRLGGTRNVQFRIEAFNAFNTVIYNARNTTLQVTSPLVLTPTNAQYDASGNLVQTRLTPQNAGFGAATGAQACDRCRRRYGFSSDRDSFDRQPLVKSCEQEARRSAESLFRKTERGPS